MTEHCSVLTKYSDSNDTTESETTNTDEDEGRELKDSATPNVKLYVVVACIAALVLVAIIQVTFILSSNFQPSNSRLAAPSSR